MYKIWHKTHFETIWSNVPTFLWYLWKCDWIVLSWYYDSHKFQALISSIFFWFFCVIKTRLRFDIYFCIACHYKLNIFKKSFLVFCSSNSFGFVWELFMSIICQKVLSNSEYTKLSQNHAIYQKLFISVSVISKCDEKSYCSFHEKKNSLHTFFCVVCIPFIFSKLCRKTRTKSSVFS